MRRGLLLAAMLLLASPAAWAQYGRQYGPAIVQNTGEAVQARTLFNFDWKFQLGPCKGAADPAFDDRGWRTLDLPHDFCFELPWDKSIRTSANDFKPSCEGWYRKTFQADTLWKGKKVFVDFDGIMYVSDVYINGHKVASGEYGYVGFDADITPWLRYDGPNVLAVHAATGADKAKSSRWYTGAGIFRDVYLKVKNPTHIVRHGIFVSTPEVSRSRASVAIQVEVSGFRGHEVKVKATVLSPDGSPAGAVEAPCDVLSKATLIETQLPPVEVAQPQLWSPDSPSLYCVKVDVYADGMLVDSESDSFGIRKIEFNKEQGFLLNGEKVFLMGISNHHDLGALGAAAFDTAIEREFRTIKAFGFNTVRCSHNPYSETFTRIADKMGILIVDELIDKWSDSIFWGGRKSFTEYWPVMIKEWIKRDRNRPSVILWSLGNELQVQERMTGFPTDDWGVTTYKMFDLYVKRFDPTRPTTVALSPGKKGGIIFYDPEADKVEAPPELSSVTDIASFNYYWRQYDTFLKHNPDLIIFQSESNVREALGPYFAMDQDKMVGVAYWGAIEYWGESNGWPKKGWNFSFFSHTLEPRPTAWLMKSGFLPDEPVVRIGIFQGTGEVQEWNDVKVGVQHYVSHWNFPEGSLHKVAVFSNGDKVELFANGRSCGIKENKTEDICMRNVIVFDNVPYGKGGSIEAVAYKGGKEVARHRIETAGKAVKLHVEAEMPGEWTADGMDLQYLKIYAVDRKGRVVPGFDEALSVSLSGPARFVALDNGDHYTDELFHEVRTKKMREGFMQLILRSTREAGPVSVSLSTPSLKQIIQLETR